MNGRRLVAASLLLIPVTLAASASTQRGVEQRVTQLEAQVQRLSAQLKPSPLVWAAAGGTEEFPAGAADTASVLEVKFPAGRFSTPPVVVVTPRWKDPSWIGGNKDSFSVQTFNVSKDGFFALVRRVHPVSMRITPGVLLDWVAIESKAAQ